MEDGVFLNITEIMANPSVPSVPSVSIGTSGFNYKWWFSKRQPVCIFYPDWVAESRALEHYATELNFVELNAPFYKLPTSIAVKRWYTQTPADFRFLVKFSRFATHNKKLADFGTYFEEFWDDRVSHLREKCLGILVQLGPAFMHSKRKSPVDKSTMLERIRKAGEYMKQRTDLPEGFRVYVEFRHTSWFCQEVYDVLTEIGWVLVCVHLNNAAGMYGKSMKSGFSPSIESYSTTVPGHIMFRCHGTWARAYHGGYSAETLVQMYTKYFGFSNAIFSFDNTDSVEGELGGFGIGKVLIKKNIAAKGRLLPHAILNAKQLRELFEGQMTPDLWMESS